MHSRYTKIKMGSIVANGTKTDSSVGELKSDSSSSLELPAIVDNINKGNLDKETEELKRATEHLCGMLSQVEERFEKLRSQINETEEESEQVTEDNMLKEQEVVISEKQAEVFEERVATILKKQAAWFEEQVAAMLVKQAAILKEQFEVLLGKQAEMLETRHADSEQRKTSAVFSRQCSHCIVKQCALCSVLDSKMM